MGQAFLPFYRQLRTFNRRFVRCTLNFSKKLENHRHAVALKNMGF